MPEPLAPDLYRIPVPLPRNPLKELNAYVILGPRNLLIDTGFRQDACRQALTAGLEDLGVDMNRTDIFLTHLHTDHTGLAPELAGPGTRIFISSRDRTRLPGKYDVTDWRQSDRFFLENGMPQAVLDAVRQQNPMQTLAPLPYDGYEAMEDGDCLDYGAYHLRVLATPGHTPGHLCLWEPERQILFSGDHVLFDITPNITRWHGVPDSLGDYLASLDRVGNLPAKTVLPGHRGAEGSLQARVTALKAHHAARCREVLDILASRGPLTAYQTAGFMHWDIRGAWADFPPAQQWFALGEAAAHLAHLEALGLLETTRKNGLTLWQCAGPAVPEQAPHNNTNHITIDRSSV